MIDEYFSTLSDKSPHTQRAYKKTVSDFVNTHPNIELCDATTIRAYLASLSHRGMKNSSVNSHIRILKAFFAWALENEYIDKNPMTKVKLLKEPKNIPAVLDDDEREKMISVAEGNERLMVAFMFYTGLRREEITNVKWSDINGNRLLVHGKGNKERIVPINDTVLSLLDEQPKNSCEYVFVSARGKHKITAESVRARVKRIAALAGIDEKKLEKVSAHTLRRSFACNLLEGGVDGIIIQKALGHTNIETTLRYVAAANGKILDKILDAQNKNQE